MENAKNENKKNINLKKKKVLDGLETDYSSIKGEDYKFPKKILPKELQNLVEELERIMCFLPEYTAIGILYAVSMAIGNKIRIRNKNTWFVSPSLYIIIVGEPGDVKSPALKFALQPLLDIDAKLYKEYLAQLAVYKRSIKNDEDAIEPQLRQQILDDFTPEALLKVHNTNKKGIGIYVDEIAGFFNSFNQYRKGSDEEFYLSAWNGGTISKVRTTTDTIRIENSFLNIIGSIQPSVLKAIFQGDRVSNGLMHRFLFVYPTNPPKVRWNINEMPGELVDLYRSYITDIYDYTEGIEGSKELRFTPEANQYLIDWQNNKPEDYDFEYEKALEIKLEEYVLRFSLILHVMKQFSAEDTSSFIDKETVQSAIKLYEFFKENACRVHESFMGTYYDRLTENQKKTFDSLPSPFTTSEGLAIVTNNKFMKERSFKNFIKDKRLFRKIKHGLYNKVIV